MYPSSSQPNNDIILQIPNTAAKDVTNIEKESAVQQRHYNNRTVNQSIPPSPLISGYSKSELIHSDNKGSANNGNPSLSVIYITLLILSLVALIICIERSIYFFSVHSNIKSTFPDSFTGTVKTHFQNNKIQTLIPPDPANDVKAAFVYLVESTPRKGTAKIKDIHTSLYKLHINFNKKYNYPVYIFHEADFDVEGTEKTLKDVYSTNVKSYMLTSNFSSSLSVETFMKNINFIQIDFEFPPGLSAGQFESFRKMRTKRLRKHTAGYSHMCRFYFKTLFEHPAIQRLQYYWRLDTDSFVESEINIDLFRYMEEHSYKYAYVHAKPEKSWMHEGMVPFLTDFIEIDKMRKDAKDLNYNTRNGEYKEAVIDTLRKNKLVWPPKDGTPLMYYNNIEIVHIPTFRERKGISEFIDAVESSNYIYIHRWGDGPLRYQQVHFYLNVATEVVHLCQFDYRHKALFPKTC